MFFWLVSEQWQCTESYRGPILSNLWVGGQTENDVKIGLDSSDEKLHRIRQEVGEFLLDGGHQSLWKTEIKRLGYEPEVSGNTVNVSVHTKPEKSENTTITGHFRLVFE